MLFIRNDVFSMLFENDAFFEENRINTLIYDAL
jgi:hypothetical protein